MVLYNLTNMTSSLYISDLVIATNQATGGVLVNGFFIAFYIIMLMAMRKADFKNAFLTANFVAFVISIPLRATGLLPFTYVMVTLVATAGTYVWMKYSDS